MPAEGMPPMEERSAFVKDLMVFFCHNPQDVTFSCSLPHIEERSAVRGGQH